MLTVYAIDIQDSKSKHIIAHRLLKQVLTLSNLSENLLQSAKRTRGGKLLAGKHYINITYADSFAFIMITEQSFGIDAETLKPVSAQVRLLLSNLLSISISNDWEFYKAWTAMESEIKYYDDKGLFDALTGKLKKNHALQTLHVMYEGNLIAITSTINNIKTQKVLFKKCKDETV